MGEPAIPTPQQQAKAVYKAREILQAIREDETPPYPRPFAATESGFYPLVAVEAREQREELDRTMWQLAATLELTNTALRVALSLLEANSGADPTGIAKIIAALETVGIDVALCADCGIRPAACRGRYPDHDAEHCERADCTQHVDSLACNECCWHGNEDGHCSPVDERPAIELEMEL